MNLLDLNDQKFKNIEVKGYKFKIRFMSPLDRVRVSQERMRLQGGNPVEALTQSDFAFFENVAIVNTCVEDYPEGFKEHESCVNWIDIDLINGVAEEIINHTKDFETKLKKNKSIE